MDKIKNWREKNEGRYIYIYINAVVCNLFRGQDKLMNLEKGYGLAAISSECNPDIRDQFTVNFNVPSFTIFAIKFVQRILLLCMCAWDLLLHVAYSLID